jgi:hypothetical protein
MGDSSAPAARIAGFHTNRRRSAAPTRNMNAIIQANRDRPVSGPTRALLAATRAARGAPPEGAPTLNMKSPLLGWPSEASTCQARS